MHQLKVNSNWISAKL